MRVYRPRLLLRPPLRPRRDLAPIPEAALTLTADRLWEPPLTDDYGRPLVGHAEDFGDLGALTVLGVFV
jgi:hypothetical protein